MYPTEPEPRVGRYRRVVRSDGVGTDDGATGRRRYEIPKIGVQWDLSLFLAALGSER
jgi:hypothetical protein